MKVKRYFNRNQLTWIDENVSSLTHKFYKYKKVKLKLSFLGVVTYVPPNEIPTQDSIEFNHLER